MININTSACIYDYIYLVHFRIITYRSVPLWKLIWTHHFVMYVTCLLLTTTKWSSKSKIMPTDSVSFINSKWVHTLYLPIIFLRPRSLLMWWFTPTGWRVSFRTYSGCGLVPLFTCLCLTLPLVLDSLLPGAGSELLSVTLNINWIVST